MATLVRRYEYDDGSFELGDRAWFKPPYCSSWVRGEIVRVYNTRTAYHVEYDGERYSVESSELSRTNPDGDGC